MLRRNKKKNPDIKKQILVVNVNWVGDVILSTPIYRALKRNYPDARISCLAVPRVREVLESCPDVDEVLVYDEKGRHHSLWGKLKIVSMLRKNKFDIAFILHRSWTRALLLFLSGIPKRVGYDAKKRGWMLTHRVEPLPETPHRSDHYINVIEDYGIAVDERFSELSSQQKETVEINRILTHEGISETDSLILVNPGGNWDLKRWPKERFAALIQRLMQAGKYKVVIPGAKKDIYLAEDIARLSGASPVILAGKTTLKQLIALLARASLLVSSDSGPLHIASSVGTKAIGLFGPTRPEVTAPRGKGVFRIIQKDIHCNREPCYRLDCPDNACMKSIEVDEVFDLVKDMMKG